MKFEKITKEEALRSLIYDQLERAGMYICDGGWTVYTLRDIHECLMLSHTIGRKRYSYYPNFFQQIDSLLREAQRTAEGKNAEDRKYLDRLIDFFEGIKTKCKFDQENN